MGNWRKEAERFCPELRCVALHGKDRHEAASSLDEYDWVIAPYSLLQRDRDRWLEAQQWHLVVLDEAQNIKNVSTNAAQVVGQLRARITPFMLRRTKALVAKDLPPKVETIMLSLKAGGVGLNLPQADTVIHFDPWWNPAAEAQATDRAHRIGQTQSLWVVKLVAQGTIEERILALQERKAALGESIYSGATGRKQPLFTEGDLAELLRPLSD